MLNKDFFGHWFSRDQFNLRWVLERLVQLGVLLTFALIPMWWRLRETPPIFVSLYSTRFVVFIAALLTILLWLLAGLPGLAAFRRDPLRAWWGLVLLTLAIWMYTSTGWAFVETSRPDIALNFALQFGVVALFALVVACAGPPPKTIVAVLAFGLLWSALLAGAQVAQQGPIGLSAFGEFRVDPQRSGVSIVGASRWLRPYGLLPHPNHLAGFFSVGLLACVYGLTASRWSIRLIFMIICTIGLWAFFLTFSRGGWLGFAAGAVMLLPLLLRAKRANSGLLAALALAVIVSVAFFLIYRDLIFSRAIVGETSTELFSAAERGSLIIAGYESILAQPLFGIGAGNQPWWAAQYLFDIGSEVRGNYAHQVWVAAWGDLGIIGLILVFIVMLLGVESALRQIRAAEGDSVGRAVLLAGFIALMISGLFDYYTWALLHFQLLWWGLLAAALSRR